MKNIPIPPKDEYLLQLIYSVEKFVRNLRWRAFFFLNPGKRGREKETHGFNSINALDDPVPELKLLEQRLLAMVRDVQFRKYSNELQVRLKEDVRTIRETQELIIQADKTSNNYKLDIPEYNRLVNRDVHKDYKKAADQDLRRANDKHKEIVKSYGLGARVMKTQARPVRATFKDHKETFQEDPKIRMINPTKCEIGRISKNILSKIIHVVRGKTKFNQWINSDEVIDWFSSLQDKQRLKFISWDICSMYPSISEKLLKNALQWASQYVEISEKDKITILAAKASLLYDLNNGIWKKKGDDFDITMGSWDGAETCDICVLYLLSKVQHLNINIGAYRDDWLAVSSQRERQVEKTKQEIAKIFKDNGLSLEIVANKTTINFLDVTFDLSTGLFSPFMKENNEIFYVHSKSNHPKTILKNLPKNVQNRLSKISANEEIFTAHAPPYQAALDASEYDHKLTFDPSARQRNRPQRRRKNRNITWFNPPWSSNVKTNIGAKFLAILKETFPPTHALFKICNRNTLKMSYRCMPNMKREISKHNNKILNGDNGAAAVQQTFGCSCQGTPKKPETCPILPGIGCLIDNVIYRATVTRTDTNQVETYTGSTAQTMKGRYRNHTYDMRHPEANGTCLSKYVHKLKRMNAPYTIKWDIVKRAAPYNPITNICRLCVQEKHHILFHPEDATLNQRSEFFTICRHKEKHLLVNS